MELILKNEDLLNINKCADTLKEIGFQKEFEVVDEGLKAINENRVYLPEEVKIINNYRFEDECDPDEKSVLNVIETNNGARGILVTVAGPYANGKVANFIARVKEIYRKRIQMKLFHERLVTDPENDQRILSI